MADDVLDSAKPSQERDWISCGTLAKRWGWSPSAVLEVIRCNDLQAHCGDEFNNYYDISTLDHFDVHRIDLEDWEIENAEKIRKPTKAVQISMENKELKLKNETLERELADCLAGLDPRQPAPSQKTQTSAATKVAQTKRLRKWKGVYIPNMFKVCLACVEEGPKERTRNEIQSVAKKECGVKFPKEVLELLRKVLPDGHVTHDPGPPRQD